MTKCDKDVRHENCLFWRNFFYSFRRQIVLELKHVLRHYNQVWKKNQTKTTQLRAWKTSVDTTCLPATGKMYHTP